MLQAQVVDRIRIEDFEKFHARRLRKPPPPVTVKEVVITMLVATVMAPFLFTTFLVSPMIGQVSVGLAAFLTALYLWFRRSVIIAVTILVSGGFFASLMFMSIQSIKYRIDVTMFVLIALGIPMTTLLTFIVAMRIWELRGGAE